jgi:hypothetical protein
MPEKYNATEFSRLQRPCDAYRYASLKAWVLKFSVFLILCVFYIFTLGCSSVNLGDAVQLANKGSQAAISYENTLNSTSVEIDRYRELQFLVAPLRNLDLPDKGLLTNIEGVQKALSARAQMMAQLANLYSSFGALASYNAEKNFEDSFSSFVGAGNHFANTLGVTGQPISALAAGTIGNVGGLITSEIQKRRVEAGSAAIRERLSQVVPFLQKEESVLMNLQRALSASAGSAAVELWNHGLGSPDPIFADNIGTFGLKYDSASFKNACQNKAAGNERSRCLARVSDAIKSVVAERANVAVEAQTKVLTSNINAINSLIAAHAQLEMGQQLNLATLGAQIAAMQAIVNNINNSIGQKASK